MKKETLIRLFIAVFPFMGSTALGQTFAVDYTAINGQNKIIVMSTIKNMPDTSKGVRTVEVSNNSTMIPLLDGKTDSVFANGTMVFIDTFNVSLTSPITHYVREDATVIDTAGTKHVAKRVNYIPVFVTPPFTKPKFSLNKALVSQTTATITGMFTSGFDTAYNELIVSYGDSLFLNPSVKYPYKSTVVPKEGSNQTNNISTTIQLGVSNYLFSYRIRSYNSVGDTLSPIFWGKTLSTPGPAMVSSPYNLNGWQDSVAFYDETVSSGLETKHTAYIATSQTAQPFDSVVKTISAGIADGTKIRNSFTGLNPETDYWVWSSVKNSKNSVGFSSNRVLVQTSKKTITQFTLVIDSTKGLSKDQQSIYWEAQTPPGENGHVIILGRTYPNGNAIVLEDLTVTGYKKGVSYFQNCIPGEVYEVTIYGYDDNFTQSYDAWVLTDTFHFVSTKTTSVNQVEQNNLKVFPNPTHDVLNVPSAGPYTIYNLSGQVIQTGSGSKIDVSKFQTEIYFIKTETGTARFVKN